jgi:hypothetical protein
MLANCRGCHLRTSAASSMRLDCDVGDGERRLVKQVHGGEDEERTSTCALGEICSERCRFPSIEIVAHGAKFLAGQIKSRFAEQ